MPINLKEIFVDDTNQIRIDKINYNFDQIVALGGQRGPIGSQGFIGPAGPTGAQGAIGPTGIAGNDGADGNDGTDGWTPISHDSVTGVNNADYDAIIIKPNLFGKPQPASVYIGDPAFDDSNNSDGDTTTRASLVVGKSDPFENNIKITIDGNPHELVIRGDASSDYGGVIYHIQKGDVNDSLNTKLELSFNDIDLNATSNEPDKGDITLSSNKTLVISPDRGFNTEVGTQSYFNDRVHVVDADLLVQGTGFTRVSKGTTSERDNIAESDLSGGNIRYNSTSGQYEAYYENTFDGAKWLNLRQLTDADGDTYISLPISNDNDKIEFVSNNDNYLRIGGTQFSLKAQSASNITVPTILVNKTIFARENLHIIEDGKGLSFKEGPAATNTDSPTGGSAVNYDTNISDRTLSDYFYRAPGFFELENLVQPNDFGFSDGNFPGLTNGDTPYLTNQIFMYTVPTSGLVGEGNETSGLQFAASVSAAADEGSNDPTGRLLTLINDNSEVSYQKIGNLVHVNVRLVWKPFTFDPNVNGNDYVPYPGTYFQQAFGATTDESKYWNDAELENVPISLNIPEMYRRLPSVNNQVISDFTHENINLSTISGAADKQTKIKFKSGNGYGELFVTSIEGSNTSIKVSDIVSVNLDPGEWIYSNFNFTYFCDSKSTWQSNVSFNDSIDGGSGTVNLGGGD